ncbi:MAG: extracellular solute-binding protein [Candidatus Sumerlaeia bacterium]|nr:extracellular solute-binding protein [Candidatus Sumerlaeia bacterium]
MVLTVSRLLMLLVLLTAVTTAEARRHRIVVATQMMMYKEGMEEVAAKYMELHPDVEVELIFIVLNYETWVRTQFSGGERMAPDIYNGNVTNTFGRMGRWVVLNDYLEADNPYTGLPWRETLEMNLVEKSKETGRFYHIPLDFIETGLFYNRDIFEKKGYEVPQSWEEMMELGERIRADGLVPFAIPGILREVWSGQVGWMARMLGDVYYRDLVPLVMAQPGDWDFDPSRDGNFVQDFSDPYDDMLVGINQERVHQAILDGVIDFRDDRSRMIYTRLKEWSRHWQDGFLGTDTMAAHRLFLTQQAVMEFHHSGNVGFLFKEMEDLPEEDRFEWGVFPVPSIKDDPLALGPMRGIGGIGSSLTVTRKSNTEHERRVIDFLMFLTAPENARVLYDRAIELRRPIVGPPAVKGVSLPQEFEERFEVFFGRGYEKLNFRGLDDEQESVYQWSVLLQDFLGDRLSLDDFLEEYQALMLAAHERIRARQGLDMDPTTNDLERQQAEAAALGSGQAVALTGIPIVLAVGLLFIGLMTFLYFQNPTGLMRRQALTAYIMLTPTFLLLVGFMYYPAIAGLFAGFTEWEEGQRQRFIGLDNFTRMLSDPFMRVGAWNQFLLLVTGVLKATIVPLIVAELVFYLKSRKLQFFFRTGFLVPLVVPAMVALLIWAFVYDPQTGVLNATLRAVGLESWQRSWLGEPNLALPSIIFLGFPWIGAFGFLIYLVGLMNIPTSVIDASRMECRSTWQRILYVDIPLLKGQTRLLIILAMIGTLQDFQTILILTQGGPGTSTMIPALHMFYGAFRFDHFGYASAIGVVLFAVILLLTMACFKFLKTEET